MENNTEFNITAEFSSSNPISIADKREAILRKGGKLQNFTLRNKNIKHINHSLYHLLLDPFTLDNAYSNLSKNKGSFTNGVNVGNIQGYSRTTSKNLVKSLQEQSYTPGPVRRVWIPKPNTKVKRPLGIPGFNDRIVQEAVRGILEAIYEPEFLEFAHVSKRCNNFGFRPNHSCWMAVEHFCLWGQQVTHVIEGDIKGAYNNVDHDILMGLLKKRIKDKNLLNLIYKMLKAGIMDEGQYEHSLLGVPQGGILSPILFNIYMFEFDKFIFDLIERNRFSNPSKQNKSQEYQRILYRIGVLKKEHNKLRTSNQPTAEILKELKSVKKTLLKTPSYPPNRNITFSYCRYADDWILGIGDTLFNAEKIKTEIEEWLAINLKLQLSQGKTHITNIRKKFVPFLGYEIILRSQSSHQKKTRVLTLSRGFFHRTVRRTTSMKFFVRPNGKRIFQNLKNIGIVRKADLYPIGKRPWASLDEFQIVQKYHSIFLGLTSHFSKCNTTAPLNRVSYIFQYSCAKTIATRKKITMPQVFQMYGQNLEITSPYLDSDKIRKIEFMGLAKIRRLYWKKGTTTSLTPYFDPFKIRTFWRTTFKLYSLCCVCGATENIEAHHINSLKSIKLNKKNKSSFDLILRQINRKQIPVCNSCHICITNGEYDGMQLSQLFSESLARL